jgi:hypothetical protein
MYKEDASTAHFNCLVIGDMGTGKTSFACTGRKPILIHSFDPGGPKSVSHLIEKGEVIADARFAKDSPDNPKSFQEWVAEMKRLEQAGIFKNIGTYVLDSVTTWSDALIGNILKKEGRKAMQIQDWGTLLTEVQVHMKALLSLPCDCVVTAHLDYLKDDTTGKISANMLIGGQSKVKMPLLFDEVYVTDTQETSKGVEYRLITKNNGKYQCRTRIGRDKFNTFEKPDLKALLEKAGLPNDDLPLLNE